MLFVGGDVESNYDDVNLEADIGAESLFSTRLFDLVRDHLAPLAGLQSAADFALAASVLWSGVHGVCLLAMDQKLQSNSGRSVYEVADSLILRYLAGLLI